MIIYAKSDKKSYYQLDSMEEEKVFIVDLSREEVEKVVKKIRQMYSDYMADLEGINLEVEKDVWKLREFLCFFQDNWCLLKFYTSTVYRKCQQWEEDIRKIRDENAKAFASLTAGNLSWSIRSHWDASYKPSWMIPRKYL
jgi:hypothetical protein